MSKSKTWVEGYTAGLLDAQRIANEVTAELHNSGATSYEIEAASKVATAILAERLEVQEAGR